MLTNKTNGGVGRMTTVMVGVTAILFLIWLWLAGHLELMYNETYYALWARNLAWCYLDHPPMVAFWIRLSTILFGESEFGVRALGTIAAYAGAGLVYALSWHLFASRDKAAFAALLYCSMLLISAGAIIISPDTPLLFFWLMALYALARIYRGGSAGWWLGVGIAIGLASLSKYTALLLGAGIACAMVVVPKMRVWWRHPAPYLAGSLAFAIFLPVVAWNYQHGWASFARQFGRVQAQGVSLRYVGELLASQIGLLTPFVFVLAVGGIWLALARRRDADSEPRQLLIALIGPMLLYFLLHSLHARVHGNWPAPAYPVLAVLGSEAAFLVSSFSQRARPLIALSRRLSVPVGLGIAGIAFLQALAAPIPLNPTADPLAVVAGWSDLAATVESFARRERATYILTSSYALTSELMYYARRPVPIMQFNERLRWLSFEQPQPNILSQPGLYVADANRDLSNELLKRFSHVTKIEEISRYRRGKQVQQYVLYRLEGPTAPILDAVSANAAAMPGKGNDLARGIKRTRPKVLFRASG